MVVAESGEDVAVHAEPPDPNVLEIDPTSRYIMVTLFFIRLFWICTNFYSVIAGACEN